MLTEDQTYDGGALNADEREIGIVKMILTISKDDVLVLTAQKKRC